jgi:hypothetical protein
VISGLATACIVAALLIAAWCFVAVARDRWIDLTHLVGLILVEIAVLVQTVVAVVRMAGGDRPVELATFAGYLVTAAFILPLGVAVSFMERTRWGAVIAGGAAVVVAVLMVRLQQTWSPLR